LEPDRHTVKRTVVHIIGRAVQRVDNPGRRGPGGWPVVRGLVFFTQKGVARKLLAEIVVDGALRREIGVGDQIETRFFFDSKALPPILQDRGGATGSFTGGILKNSQFSWCRQLSSLRFAASPDPLPEP